MGQLPGCTEAICLICSSELEFTANVEIEFEHVFFIMVECTSGTLTSPTLMHWLCFGLTYPFRAIGVPPSVVRTGFEPVSLYDLFYNLVSRVT